MVITRSESVKISNDLGSSLGSLNSLCDKPYSHLDNGNRRRTYHKVSKSLDLDVDGVSNEGNLIEVLFSPVYTVILFYRIYFR